MKLNCIIAGNTGKGQTQRAVAVTEEVHSFLGRYGVDVAEESFNEGKHSLLESKAFFGFSVKPKLTDVMCLSR